MNTFDNNVLVSEAVNEAIKEKPSCRENIDDLIEQTYFNFINNKLTTFPALAAETRRVNFLVKKQFEDMDNSKGWSENKTFKFDYQIPKELYLFMTNLVYRDFWSDKNEKVWRSFMKAIIRGDDPMTLLVKVKMYYGSSKDVFQNGKDT
jgi:hypothetical protein